MSNFKFEGITTSGRSVQGTVTAKSVSEAKLKIRKLAERHKVKVSRIIKRKTFLYTAHTPNNNQIKGTQKAFTKDEVKAALKKLGYKKINIKPKLFDFTLPPPGSEIVAFVRVSAVLLREKLPFTEVLQLLTSDIQNNTLRNTIKEINNDLRKGDDSEEAFNKQEKVLGRFTARMLGLASKSGSMADLYESTAKFLERNMEFKRNLKSALVMPSFTVLVLILAVLFYIIYIFPETANLMKKLGDELPPMTAAVLVFSTFMESYFSLIIGGFVGLGGAIVYYFRTSKGRFLWDKYVIKLPILGTLVHKTLIEIFCRVFHALYSSSGENIETIKLAAEATNNKYFERQIKTIAIPMMLSEGRGLVEAFEASNVFTKAALSRFNSGAETGTVKDTTAQIANFYEKETVYKLKNVIEVIQLSIAMFITIVITGLTLLSSETAMISPKSPF